MHSYVSNCLSTYQNCIALTPQLKTMNLSTASTPPELDLSFSHHSIDLRGPLNRIQAAPQLLELTERKPVGPAAANVTNVKK